MMKKVEKVLAASAAVLAGLLLAVTVQAAEDAESEILERIKPVGTVCIEGSDCGRATTVATASGGAPAGKSGEEVYNTSCAACHGTGLMEAPKIGNVDDWAARIANGKDTMLSNAINGIKAMPPKGTCMGCSDEELAAAIEHMLP
jgi:cytochrome c5